MIANLETGDIATSSAPALESVHTAPFILIVADGVGGAALGALASSIATETIPASCIDGGTRSQTNAGFH